MIIFADISVFTYGKQKVLTGNLKLPILTSPELIEQHIFEICEMLKFGFGRWNEPSSSRLQSLYKKKGLIW